MGDTATGTARLDEVMLSVTAGEVGPITSGIVYCAVDPRVHEAVRSAASVGVDATRSANWCDAQPDLVPYRGQCLVHRSQLQQAAGDWHGREHHRRVGVPAPHRPAASGSRAWPTTRRRSSTGCSVSFDEAEVEYRRASRHGYQPMPGLALLELARGHVDGGGGHHPPSAAGGRRSAGTTGPCWPRPSTSSGRPGTPLARAPPPTSSSSIAARSRVGDARGDGNPGHRHRAAGRGRSGGRAHAPAGGGRRVAALAHAVRSGRAPRC